MKTFCASLVVAHAKVNVQAELTPTYDNIGHAGGLSLIECS